MAAICKQKVNETLSARMGENLRSPARALRSSIFGTGQKSKYTPTPAINGKIKTYSRISPLIEAFSFPRENFSFAPSRENGTGENSIAVPRKEIQFNFATEGEGYARNFLLIGTNNEQKSVCVERFPRD